MAPAAMRMNGLNGCHRAIATAPDTPSTATVHGPTQHKPINDAKRLKLTAPAPEAMISFLSCTVLVSAKGSAPGRYL
jgi:hypothetical protein